MACRPERLPALLLALALGAPGAFAQSQPAGDGKLLQCWTDDGGHRICGDRVPPDDARREREFYDRRGVVKRVVPAQKSAEQLASEEQARREAEAGAARDRFLTQTYRSPEEIERARDDRLGALDGRLKLAQKNLADGAATLDDLRKRSEPDDPQAAASLRAQIATFEKATRDNQAAIETINGERARTVADFNQQLTRFRELRAAGGTRQSAD